MILWASVRKDFDHTTRHEPNGAIIVREMPGGPNISPTVLQGLTGRIGVFGHGYRSPLEVAEGAYARMADQLYDDYDHIVKFLWPGSWEVAIGFMAANLRVQESAVRLCRLMNWIHPNPVTVWLHSLGCKVGLEANRMLSPDLQGCTRLVLAAPAVDWDCLQVGATYGDTLTDIRVAWSKGDPVLGKMYRMAPNNWFSPALGHDGLKEGKYRHAISSMDFSQRVDDHGGYRDDLEFYRYGLAPISDLKQRMAAPVQVEQEVSTNE